MFNIIFGILTGYMVIGNLFAMYMRSVFEHYRNTKQYTFAVLLWPIGVVSWIWGFVNAVLWQHHNHDEKP